MTHISPEEANSALARLNAHIMDRGHLDQQVKTVRDFIQQSVTLTKRTEELEGALLPFAEAAESCVLELEADSDWIRYGGADAKITIGDLRRARNAIGQE